MAEGRSSGSQQDANFGRISAELKSAAISFAALTSSALLLSQSVSSFRTLERELTITNAVAQGTTKQFLEMEKAVRQFAISSKFSAAESAEALFFLASAGFSVEQSLAAMTGVLTLAQATMKDIVLVSDIVASNIRAFGLEARDAARISNVFAAANAGSQATLEKLGFALRQVGPVAGSFGITIEETAGALGILFNVGLRGEQAGTALRNILLRLINPTEEVSRVLTQLGIGVSDVTTGKFLGLSTVLKQIAAENLPEATKAIIFGTEALAGANAALTAAKSGKLDEFTKQITGTQTASRIALQQLNTFDGSVIRLQNSFTELGLTVGSDVNPILRDVFNITTGLIRSFKDLDDATKSTSLITLFAGLAGVATAGTAVAFAGIVATIGLVPALIAAVAGAAAAGTAFIFKEEIQDFLNRPADFEGLATRDLQTINDSTRAANEVRDRISEQLKEFSEKTKTQERIVTRRGTEVEAANARLQSAVDAIFLASSGEFSKTLPAVFARTIQNQPTIGKQLEDNLEGQLKFLIDGGAGTRKQIASLRVLAEEAKNLGKAQDKAQKELSSLRKGSAVFQQGLLDINLGDDIGAAFPLLQAPDAKAFIVLDEIGEKLALETARLDKRFADLLITNTKNPSAKFELTLKQIGISRDERIKAINKKAEEAARKTFGTSALGGIAVLANDVVNSVLQGLDTEGEAIGIEAQTALVRGLGGLGTVQQDFLIDVLTERNKQAIAIIGSANQEEAAAVLREFLGNRALDKAVADLNTRVENLKLEVLKASGDRSTLDSTDFRAAGELEAELARIASQKALDDLVIALTDLGLQLPADTLARFVSQGRKAIADIKSSIVEGITEEADRRDILGLKELKAARASIDAQFAEALAAQTTDFTTGITLNAALTVSSGDARLESDRARIRLNFLQQDLALTKEIEELKQSIRDNEGNAERISSLEELVSIQERFREAILRTQDAALSFAASDEGRAIAQKEESLRIVADFERNTRLTGSFFDGLTAASAKASLNVATDAENGFRAFELVTREIASGLTDALFDTEATFSETLSRMLSRFARFAADIVFKSAANKLLGGILDLDFFGSAKGNVFRNGQPEFLARGGIVKGITQVGPNQFAGEAGPEGILPLSRGATGRLGVDATGLGQNITVTSNPNIQIVIEGGGGGSAIDAEALQALAAKLDDETRKTAMEVILGQLKPGGILAGRIQG